MVKTISVSRFVVALAMLYNPSVARPAAVQSTQPSTGETYAAAYFTRFAPNTALDMLRQVPGFVVTGASRERGLGQATGNVLINGQRISGKSNDAVTELNRIPAPNVVRIEIVDGSTLEIPGLSGQVANIITQAAAIVGQYAWRPEFRLRYTKPLFSRGEVSISGAMGPVEYTVGLENRSFRNGASGPTRIATIDGEPLELRDESFHGDGEQPRISGNFVYDGPGTSIGNLNVSYGRLYYDYREVGSRSRPGFVNRERRINVDQDSSTFEIGGDYSLRLGPGRLKFIGLNRLDHTPANTDLITSFADSSPASGTRFTRDSRERETVVRSEYSIRLGKADWQLSAERAFNSLDNVSRLFALLPSGGYEEVPLPGGTAKVHENRYEVALSHGRAISSKLNIKLSAGAEYSQLNQVGDNGQKRTFYRFKGLTSANWKATKSLDLNFKLQRLVGQLNFLDFLASVNLTDDREDAGNPNLVPQQSWLAELEAINSLGKFATTTLRLYAEVIDDIVDIIPIGESGESPGNIERAYLYGLDLKSTVDLRKFGWIGAKIDGRLQLQESGLDDVLTGMQRPISNSLGQLATISLRHDIPKTDWAWGGNISYQKRELNYRLSEVGRAQEGPVFGSLFIEHKNVLGLVVRATANNLLGADSTLNRVVYVRRRTGPAAFVERRNRDLSPIFFFSARGKF